MSVVLSLVGNSVRIEQSSNDNPTYEFSLLSCGILFDDAASSVEFFEGSRRVLVNLTDITSPTLADYAALKAQVQTWKQNAFKVGGKMGEPVEVTLTRPADTTAYAVNDVISNSTTAPTAIIFDMATAGVEAGGSGYLVKLRALTNLKTWTGRLRIHLYKTVIVPGNDNSAFGLLWANRANRIAYIDVPAFSTADATASDCAHSLIADLRIPFKLSADDTRLWAIVQNLDAPTPASGQIFFFSLLADRN